jgi:hypothetical protein
MFLTAKMLAVVWLIAPMIPLRAADAGRRILSGHVPAVTRQLTAAGRLSATNVLSLAIGLPLRHEDQLGELLRQLYDPASTNYHRYLTPQEFTARFGPTEADYAAVRAFAETNGFVVGGTHPNRVVLDVKARSTDVEKAFHVTLHLFRHPTERRDFFAPDTEPSVLTNLSILHISGLDNYSLPKPMSRVKPLAAVPMLVTPQTGSGASGSFMGNDFRASYVPGTTLTGSGQSVALVQFDGYYSNDIASYISTAGITTEAVLTNVAVNGGVSTPGSGNGEVCLDIEMVLAMAPGVSQIIVYEAPSSTAWSTMLSKIANDNLARQISCSWGYTSPGQKDQSSENAFKQMSAQGQSFFTASGDSDAYIKGVPFPAESTNITVVGGTVLTMNGTGDSYDSETVWNEGTTNTKSGGYWGSSGGISLNYGMPPWQKGINMINNYGSTNQHNMPDVALTGENIFVVYNNGTLAAASGTSCAAPLWAGFIALVNQQMAINTGSAANSIGFINPAVYAIGKSSCYNSCFHDMTTGNNSWPNSTTNFPAVTGYDLCTGWGTPNGTNLINALIWPPPSINLQPAGKTVTNGANVTINAAASSTTTMTYNWLFNEMNLSDSGNISGSTSNVLTVTSATTNNSGSYRLIASNITGSMTSSVAVLKVGFVPAISIQPTNLTLLSGSNAVFSATLSGSLPLAYQWSKNGTNISGATNHTLTLSAITTNSSASYSLRVTNLYGSVTSSVATLTVVLPPTITSTTLTNRTGECGLNTNSFFITTGGTAPLGIQWSLNGTAISGATATNFGLTNLDMSTNTLSVTVTNPYAGVSSNVVLSIRDTKAPVISLNGSNPFYLELGGAFTDPGAMASDTCAGSVAVVISGSVNSNAVGTNTLSYTAGDGHGNTNSVTRTVLVRDTTPPAILGSFTNLVLAADTNCSATMPNVTGTNFIIATDLSGTLTFAQSPTNGATLPLGTNAVVITVKDASGNTAYSTNQIVVLDETPPQIVSGPQSQTNIVGSMANFSVAATACTPLAFQWFFNTAALAAQTNGTLAVSNLTSSASGNYFVVVSASGGSSTSAVATLTVELLPAALALTSSENPSGFQDGVIFIAGVTPANATGTVQFYTNGAALDAPALVAGAVASPLVASLPRGTNVITAVYSGDANDLPVTNSLAQIVTNHPPASEPAFYTNTTGFPLSIAIADLATNWSDVDGDTVSLAAVGVSTNGTVLTNTGTALVYFNTNRVADQFVCVLTDGWGGTNFQTVGIVPPDRTPRIGVVELAGNGSIILPLGGASGDTCILETTTNLVSANWRPVATNTLDDTGVWLFTDTLATHVPQRFYRLKRAP